MGCENCDKHKSEHNEATCEACGGYNPPWAVDTDRWLAIGRPGAVLCPSCFACEYEKKTGLTPLWKLEPARDFVPVEDHARYRGPRKLEDAARRSNIR